METAKVGAIRNPLTIIAIFAGIAEISGTAVLPHIAPENQYVYIWFLMLFPTVLIIIFFATLNFNHKVLYAPSDFNDQSHFINILTKATPHEVLDKVAREASVDAAEPPPAADTPPAAQTPSVTEQPPAPAEQTGIIVAASPPAAPENGQQLAADAEPDSASSTTDFHHWNKWADSVDKALSKWHATPRELEQFSIKQLSRAISEAPPEFDVKIGGTHVFDAATQTPSGVIIWESFVVSNIAHAREKVKEFLDAATVAHARLDTNSKGSMGVAINPIYPTSMSEQDQYKCTAELTELVETYSVQGTVIPKKLSPLFNALNVARKKGQA